MSILDYIQELNRLKLQAESRFGDIGSIEREMFDQSYDWLLENLEIQRGRFVVSNDLVEQMNAFVQAVVKIAQTSSEFNGRVARYLTDINTIEKNLVDFHATQNDIDVRKMGIKPEQEVFIDAITDAYLDNGLNQHFANPLKDLIYRNTLGGLSLKEAKQVLKNYIEGGKDQSGKLQRYLLQTAQQGVDSYTGMINVKLKQNFKFDGYIISGSLIETSSPQCIEAVQDAADSRGFLSNEKWEEILKLAASHGLIKGTTLENLALNKLHWGCRHEFTPAYEPKETRQERQQKKDLKDRIKDEMDRNGDSRSMNIDDKGNFTAERKKLHKDIVNDFIKDANSHTNTVFTLGGAPANGKSTLVDSGLVPFPEGAVMVNADLIRERIPEYQQMTADKNPLASAFSHEEASYVSKQLIDKALAIKNDFVLDGVNDGEFEKLNAKIQRYKDAGNRVRADYVTLDTELSQKLAKIRGDKTGRYVPEDYLLEMNQEISKLVPQLLEAGTFDELNLWDTNQAGKPRLILSQKDGTLKIYDQSLYNNFLNKAK